MEVTSFTVNHNTTLSELSPLPQTILQLCPDCSEGELVMRGHCNECLLCGWRACSVNPNKGN